MKWLLFSILFLSCASHKNIQAQQEEVKVKEVNGYLVVEYYDYEDCNFNDSVGSVGQIKSNKTTLRLKPKKRVVASFHSNDSTVSQQTSQTQTTKTTEPASVQLGSHSFFFVILMCVLVIVIVIVFLGKVFR